MKVGITGASGFVGSHLLPFLQAKGHDMLPMNLREKSSVLSFAEMDSIVHLAGKAHDHKGIATREDYFNVNFELTKFVFQAFLNSEARYFIHFSTVAAVTDEFVEDVLTEEAKPHPTTPYGQSKLAAEEYLLAQKLPQNKKMLIIRPAMIHGPGDKGNLRLLYKMVVKGIPYPLAAFNNSRSFLGIDNLCYVIDKLLCAKKLDSGIYNLVDDTPISTRQVIEIIADSLEKKPRMLSIPAGLIKIIAKLGDISPFPLNTKRLRKMTSDFVVSNTKIKSALELEHLPKSAIDGLRKSVDSFKQ